LSGASPNRSVSPVGYSGSAMSNPKTSTFFVAPYVIPLIRSISLLLVVGGGISGFAPIVLRGGDSFTGSSRLGGVGDGLRGFGASNFA